MVSSWRTERKNWRAAPKSWTKPKKKSQNCSHHRKKLPKSWIPRYRIRWTILRRIPGRCMNSTAGCRQFPRSGVPHPVPVLVHPAEAKSPELSQYVAATKSSEKSNFLAGLSAKYLVITCFQRTLAALRKRRSGQDFCIQSKYLPLHMAYLQ